MTEAATVGARTTVAALCPFCGGMVIRAGLACGGGSREFSLCCNVGLELIDNYEVLAALPEELRQIALDQDRAEEAGIWERERVLAEAFAESYAKWTPWLAERGMLKGQKHRYFAPGGSDD